MTTFVPVPDQYQRTLLRELNHRVNGELASAINALSTAAVRTENPNVKSALSNVVESLQQRADVHRALTMPNRARLIDAAEYIRKLGVAMSRSSLEPIGIRIALIADTLPLESERCWRLALAVHELVTNAARHACFDGREGAINIKLSLAHLVVNCIVSDNGSLPRRLKPGRGLRIVSDLAKSLGGRIEYGCGARFSSFLLVFPVTERERQANRLLASRRATGTHRRKAIPPQSQLARQPSSASDATRRRTS